MGLFSSVLFTNTKKSLKIHRSHENKKAIVFTPEIGKAEGLQLLATGRKLPLHPQICNCKMGSLVADQGKKPLSGAASPAGCSRWQEWDTSSCRESGHYLPPGWPCRWVCCLLGAPWGHLSSGAGPRETVQSPSLEVSKAQLNKALSSLVWPPAGPALSWQMD